VTGVQTCALPIYGNDLSNHTQATAVSGHTIMVLPVQTPAVTGSATNERIRVLHTDTAQNENGSRVRGNVCLAFVDTGPGTTSARTNYPAIVRDRSDMPGRLNFGASFADAGDGNVVMQGNNDRAIDPPPPLYSNGLETGAGSLESLAPPTVTIAPGDLDKRLDTGIQHDERCQFVLDLPNGDQEQWVVGDRTIPESRGSFFYFGQHSFDVSPTGEPTVELQNQWLIGRVNSRFGIDAHGYYRGLTSHPLLDDYTTSTVGTPAWPQPPAPQPGSPTDPLVIAETFLTGARVGSPDGVLVFGRDTVLDYLSTEPGGLMPPGPFRQDPWLELARVYDGAAPWLQRSEDWTFTLNSHPEWNNLEYDALSALPTTPMGPYDLDFAKSQQLFWLDPVPAFPPGEFDGRLDNEEAMVPIIEAATTFTFLPKVESVPSHVAGAPESLILAVPCGYASCSPDLSSLLGTTLAIDPSDPFPPQGITNWGQDYHFLPISPSFNASGVWAEQFRRGFVSLWQVSGEPAFPTYENGLGTAVLPIDPWSRARRATEPTPELLSPTGGQLLPERPAGSPDLPALFLEGDGTCAFGLQFVKLTDSADTERTLAIVAEFTGSVQVFDITEILQNPYVEKIDVDPDFVWYAPEDPLDRRRPNVFDAEADPLSTPGQANVYVACSRMGVCAVTLDVEQGFVSDTERIVTTGSAHSVSIRRSPQGTLMLVGDHLGGVRFYRRP